MINAKKLCQWAAVVGVIITTVGCGSELPTAHRPDMKEVKSIREGFGAAASESTGDSDRSGPTGYAALRGSFRLNGNVPTLSTLNSQISKSQDAAVCAPGGQTVYDQDVVVDASTKGIGNVLIYAEKVPEEWVHESAKPGKTGEIIFDQKNCLFLTRFVGMQTSQSMRALNSDPVGHNLKIGSYNPIIPAGGEVVYEPSREERFPVEMACNIHPWMKAWMIVRDNSYFAITKPDGTFEIPNLPAGVKLNFRVWQERVKAVSDVSVDGAPTSWPKGRFSLTLEPDTDVEMDVVLDASIFEN